MPVFQIKKKKLLPVKEKRFNLESDLQKLVEDNLKTLFGLEFVSSEFPIEGFYIDTLAYDPETNSFVIIEYKKGKDTSIVDQGLHYLSLMLSHKADFILEINEKLKKPLNKKSVDWSQSRVMFLARSFTSYQTGSTSFRDFPIELWEVSLYESGLIDFNLAQAPKTIESITKVAKGKDIERVAREVAEFTIGDHRGMGSSITKELLEGLRQRILDIDERIKEKPVKFYIGYKTHGSNFVALRVRKSKVLVDIRIKKPKNSRLAINKRRQYAWDKTPIWRFEIKNQSEIRKAMDLIEQSYNYYESKYT